MTVKVIFACVGCSAVGFVAGWGARALVKKKNEELKEENKLSNSFINDENQISIVNDYISKRYRGDIFSESEKMQSRKQMQNLKHLLKMKKEIRKPILIMQKIILQVLTIRMMIMMITSLRLVMISLLRMKTMMRRMFQCVKKIFGLMKSLLMSSKRTMTFLKVL